MSRTSVQKAIRRIRREYEQCKEVPLSTKASLLAEFIKQYDKPRERYSLQDYENLKTAQLILEELQRKLASVDIHLWIYYLQHKQEAKQWHK